MSAAPPPPRKVWAAAATDRSRAAAHDTADADGKRACNPNIAGLLAWVCSGMYVVHVRLRQVYRRELPTRGAVHPRMRTL
jgi:hypothetical protein